MFKIELQWKDGVKVNLPALDAQLRADHSEYSGNQAYSKLELWFNQEPSQAAKNAINDLWASIDEDHELAASYKSAEEIKAEQEAKKASAKSKLAALGLSADELKALLG